MLEISRFEPSSDSEESEESPAAKRLRAVLEKSLLPDEPLVESNKYFFSAKLAGLYHFTNFDLDKAEVLQQLEEFIHDSPRPIRDKFFEELIKLEKEAQ